MNHKISTFSPNLMHVQIFMTSFERIMKKNSFRCNIAFTLLHPHLLFFIILQHTNTLPIELILKTQVNNTLDENKTCKYKQLQNNVESFFKKRHHVYTAGMTLLIHQKTRPSRWHITWPRRIITENYEWLRTACNHTHIFVVALCRCLIMASL